MRTYTTYLNTWLRLWILLILILSKMYKTPLGIVNCNPLNIRYSPMNKWRGQTGCNRGFCTFTSMNYGIRAALVLLKNYKKRGVESISGIISTWAPSNENDTKSYISTVRRQMEDLLGRGFIGTDYRVRDLDLPLLAYSMSLVECGSAAIKAAGITVDTFNEVYKYTFNNP